MIEFLTLEQRILKTIFFFNISNLAVLIKNLNRLMNSFETFLNQESSPFENHHDDCSIFNQEAR